MQGKQRQRNETKSASEASLACLAMWLATFTQVFRDALEELAAAAYRETLKSYSADQIDRGCREALRQCTFFPRPAEIIKFIEATAEGDYAPKVMALQEPPLTAEESRKILADLRAKAALLRDQPKRAKRA